jgi:hypothetical protein
LAAIQASCGPATHFTVGASVPEGGSCVSTAVVDAEAPVWGAEMRLCAPATGPAGCVTGTCFAPGDVGDAVDGGVGTSLCIAQRGTLPCPGEYPVSRSFGDAGTPYSDGVVDGRTCTCSCGAPSGVVCDSQVALFGPPGCSGGLPGMVVEGGAPDCMALPPALWASATPSPSDGGSCAPYGGPTGELTAGPAYTVCCTR